MQVFTFDAVSVSKACIVVFLVSADGGRQLASMSATAWLRIMGIAYHQAITGGVVTHTQQGCYSFDSAFFCAAFDKLQLHVQLCNATVPSMAAALSVAILLL